MKVGKILAVLCMLWGTSLFAAPKNSNTVFEKKFDRETVGFYLTDGNGVNAAVFSDSMNVQVHVLVYDESEAEQLKKMAFECRVLVNSANSRKEYEEKKIYESIVKKFQAFGKLEEEFYDFFEDFGFVKVNCFASAKGKDEFELLKGGNLFARGEPISSGDKLNISIFTIQSRDKPPADNATYKWIEENFGVTFTWDILKGDKDRKIASLIRSDNRPDLVEVDSTKFQDAGCLRDLKPLIEEYAPNLRKHYESAWKQMIDCDSEKDDDGKIIREHIYSLPNYGVYDGIPSESNYNGNAFWIQKRVLKEFGYPVIRTVDEYFDLLEKYSRKYPFVETGTTIPFSIITYDWEAFDLWNPPNFLAGYPNDGNGYVTKEGNRYVYNDLFTDECSKRWFKLANGYYKRGLIDPASFTDNRDQYYDKINKGRVLGMFIQGWQFLLAMADPIYIADEDDEKTYVPLALTFDENIKPRYRDVSLPNLQRGYGITVNCPEDKAIKIIQFMDKMLEEENQRILYWGFEGVDWQKDDQGRSYRTEEQRQNHSDYNYLEHNCAVLWREEAPKLEGMMPSGYTRVMDELPWEKTKNASNLDKEIFDAYGVSSYCELMDPDPLPNDFWYPMWRYYPEYDGDWAETMAYDALDEYEDIQKKYLPMCIMAASDEEFERIWDEYCEELSPYTAIFCRYMQDQLDRLVKTLGPDE
ncbi:MAG: extracellular solute-binding protein [Treponema sp.]|nr:extracellular solute-binding protein [Treponema sp.]